MKYPKCEYCGIKEAVSFSFFVNDMDDNKLCCLLVCNCTNEEEKYYIEFKHFFRSKSTVIDWLCHMSGKRWFDAEQFIYQLNKIWRLN